MAGGRAAVEKERFALALFVGVTILVAPTPCSAMLVLFVPSSSLALSASLKVDGSAGAVGNWDKAALLKGYQNSAELPAREVTCAELPQDLVGTYYRNAPQRFTGYDGRKVRHPFDADGMVTAVTLDGRRGKAVVRQRYVATDGAVAERESGKTLFPGQFGNPLPFWSGGSNFKNLANTNVLAHGGKLLALWEGSRPHLLDPLSLATEGEWTGVGWWARGHRRLLGAPAAHREWRRRKLCILWLAGDGQDDGQVLGVWARFI